MEAQSIKVGDVVRVKGSSRLIGVNKITGEKAECVWHEKGGIPFSEEYDIKELEFVRS